MFCTACAAPNPAAASRCAACGAGLGGRDGGGRTGGLERGAARRWWRAARVGPRRRLLRVLYLVPVLALFTTGAVGAGRYRADRADRAARRARAEAAAAAGDHATAAAAFADVGSYRDAEARHAAALAALAPYRATYLDGVEALAAGRYDGAIAALLPVARDLPGYEDAAALLAAARVGRAAELRRQADAAETRGDWLAAERALATLAAVEPDDAALAERLDGLRRAHAPLVFVRDRALYLVGPDGADERILVDQVPAAWPVWSPDRGRIAFVSVDFSDPAANTRLFVVNADGTGLTRLDDWVSYQTPRSGARTAPASPT